MQVKPGVTALLVGVALITAGCMGPAADSPDNSTLPADDSDSPQHTAEETARSPTTYAPGVTSDGVDPLKLANAHQEELSSRTFRKTKTIGQANMPPSVVERFHYRNDTTWRWTLTGDGPGAGYGEPNGSTVRYANGSAVYQHRMTASGEVRTGVLMSSHGPESPREAFDPVVYERDLIYGLLARGNPTIAPGERSAALVTGTVESATVGGDRVSEIEYLMTVSERGLVSSLYIQYKYEKGSYQQTIRFTTSDVEPVQPPEWVNSSSMNRKVIRHK